MICRLDLFPIVRLSSRRLCTVLATIQAQIISDLWSDIDSWKRNSLSYYQESHSEYETSFAFILINSIKSFRIRRNIHCLNTTNLVTKQRTHNLKNILMQFSQRDDLYKFKYSKVYFKKWPFYTEQWCVSFATFKLQKFNFLEPLLR